MKKSIKLRSKISFINNNVLKSSIIIKNLWINSRTELAIALSRFFFSQVLLEKQKCAKTEYKERLEKQMNETLNIKKFPNHPLIFFSLFKKIEKLKLNKRFHRFSLQT